MHNDDHHDFNHRRSFEVESNCRQMNEHWFGEESYQMTILIRKDRKVEVGAVQRLGINTPLQTRTTIRSRTVEQ